MKEGNLNISHYENTYPTQTRPATRYFFQYPTWPDIEKPYPLRRFDDVFMIKHVFEHQTNSWLWHQSSLSLISHDVHQDCMHHHLQDSQKLNQSLECLYCFFLSRDWPIRITSTCLCLLYLMHLDFMLYHLEDKEGSSRKSPFIGIKWSKFYGWEHV